jgi:hypothetical protein
MYFRERRGNREGGWDEGKRDRWWERERGIAAGRGERKRERR